MGVGESAGEFVVVVGSQPVFTNKDRGLCDLIADQKKLDGMRSGTDLTDKEHLVRVGQVFVKEGEAKGYIKF